MGHLICPCLVHPETSMKQKPLFNWAILRHLKWHDDPPVSLPLSKLRQTLIQKIGSIIFSRQKEKTFNELAPKSRFWEFAAVDVLKKHLERLNVGVENFHLVGLGLFHTRQEHRFKDRNSGNENGSVRMDFPVRQYKGHIGAVFVLEQLFQVIAESLIESAALGIIQKCHIAEVLK